MDYLAQVKNGKKTIPPDFIAFDKGMYMVSGHQAKNQGVFPDQSHLFKKQI